MKNAPVKLMLIVTLSVSAYFFISYGKESYPFYGDAMGYYMYLPSTFIYHNHKALDWLPEEKHLDKTVRGYIKYLKTEPRTPKGYIISKYTYGVAAMELPFFLAAHAYEKIRGKEDNGYSLAYRSMLKVSSIVYALLGLLLVYRILKLFFDNRTSILTVCILLVGTNLFWFAFYQAGMAQVPLFFLYAALIYTTILLHRTPKAWLFIAAGLAAGLITIIRPTDIICLLIPILFNVYNRETLRQKGVFLSANMARLFLFAVFFALPIVPQMLYWKKFAGSFLYYSYGSETFNWLHPRIFDGIFSFYNGWLVYSPVMIVALLGLLLLRNIRAFTLSLLTILPLYIYIVYSWYCYNYINGLGSRPMIDIYPLLSLPAAAFIQYLTQRKAALRTATFLIIVFLVSINISYSLQQARGILISEESNFTYNLHMLYKMRANYSDLVTYDIQQVQPDPGKLEKIATLACENYEDSTSPHFAADPTGKSKYVYHMAADEEYHPKTLNVKYNSEQFKNVNWIKCSGSFMYTQPYLYHKHLLTLDFMKDNKSIGWFGCKINNKVGLTEPGAELTEFSFGHVALNKWGTIYFFVKAPKELANGDNIRLDVWNIGKQEIYFDNICIELYRNK